MRDKLEPINWSHIPGSNSTDHDPPVWHLKAFLLGESVPQGATIIGVFVGQGHTGLVSLLGDTTW